MLPKINRIKKKKDFEAIFKNSKSLKGSHFIFRITKNNLGVNRVGFVVSLKISKKATVRNRIRRRLAEIIKKEIEKIENGTDLVIIALPAIVKKEFCDIKDDISEALVRAKLIKAK